MKDQISSDRVGGVMERTKWHEIFILRQRDLILKSEQLRSQGFTSPSGEYCTIKESDLELIYNLARWNRK